MLDRTAVVYSLSEVPADRTLEHFHHESEQGTCQSSIPPPLGRFVANESVLCLDLEELPATLAMAVTRFYAKYTYGGWDIRIFKRLTDQITARARYVCVLYHIW